MEWAVVQAVELCVHSFGRLKVPIYDAAPLAIPLRCGVSRPIVIALNALGKEFVFVLYADSDVYVWAR